MDITILFSESPTARAYLATLKLAGVRPKRLIKIINRNDLSSGKPVGRWLPPPVRRSYASWHQAMRMNYWPRRLQNELPSFVSSTQAQAAEHFNLPPSIFPTMVGPRLLHDIADEVEEVFVDGLGDPSLPTTVARASPAVILFTGGGILPDALLGLEGIRFLHVHPGALPDVRGSDGLLWSMLVYGRLGASAFFMAPGIDTGALVRVQQFPAIKIRLPAGPRPNDDTLYRAVYAFIDPLLRAATLMKTLSGCDAPAQLTSNSQDASTGVTYRFMNPVLRARALAEVFVS